MEKNVIVRSNREYDYIGNVLEYDYFPSYSSTRTQKALVFEYEYMTTSTLVRLLHLWVISLFYSCYKICMPTCYIYITQTCYIEHFY